MAIGAEVHISVVLKTKSNTHADSVNCGLNKNTSEREGSVSGRSAEGKKSKSLAYIIQI